MTQPIVALMKVITFPLMGAEPHNISLTLPPTWKQATTNVKSVSEYMSTCQHLATRLRLTFCLTNQKSSLSQTESFLTIPLYSSSVLSWRPKLNT